MTHSLTQPVATIDPLHHRLLDSIVHKKTVVGSFPLDYPLAQLTRTLMEGLEGPVVWVFPDRLALRQQAEAFIKAGWKYPDFAVLNALQSPVEERQIKDMALRGRVKLLLITVDRFASLLFLQTVARMRPSLVMVDQAQMLLPYYDASPKVEKLIKALDQLAVRPALLFLTPTLPALQLRLLAVGLGAEDYELVVQPPCLQRVDVSVVRCQVRGEKDRVLKRLVAASKLSSLERAEEVRLPTCTVIYVDTASEADSLSQRLQDWGYSAQTYSVSGDMAQTKAVEQAVYHHPGQIVVAVGSAARYLRLPEGRRQKLIYWSLPPSVDALLSMVFRPADMGHGGVEASVIYCKDDIEKKIDGVYGQDAFLGPKQAEQLRAYRELQGWIREEACRYRSLAERYLSPGASIVLDVDEDGDIRLPKACGVCDRCQSQKWPPLVTRFLNRLLY